MTRRKSITRQAMVALACFVAVSLEPARSDEQGEVEVSAGGSSWHWTPEEWTFTKTFDDVGNVAKRPDDAVLKAVTVEWHKAELDALGNLCTIRGDLSVRDATNNQTRPVDWFQGVTVYMGMAPDAKPDWTKGMNQADTVHSTAVVKKSGRFELWIDLRETQRQRNSEERFQIAVALATHSGRGESGQKVVWNSRTPAIPATVQLLTVPAVAGLSRELELINCAAGWPFVQRKLKPTGVDLIRAVNALQKLGKEQALATLEKYVELTQGFGHHWDQEIVFWIIRLLFEPIRLGDHIPRPLIAVILDDREFADDMKWPLNPLELNDDVPFMVGEQINMGGMPEHPSSHILWARRHGIIRDNPLTPVTNPLQAAESILASRRFKTLLLGKVASETAISQIRLQAIVLVKDLLQPINIDEFGQISDEQWKACLEEAERLGIHWDAKLEQFAIKAK